MRGKESAKGQCTESSVTVSPQAIIWRSLFDTSVPFSRLFLVLTTSNCHTALPGLVHALGSIWTFLSWSCQAQWLMPKLYVTKCFTASGQRWKFVSVLLMLLEWLPAHPANGHGVHRVIIHSTNKEFLRLLAVRTSGAENPMNMVSCLSQLFSPCPHLIHLLGMWIYTHPTPHPCLAFAQFSL